MERVPLKLLLLDFNFVREGADPASVRTSMAHEFANTDADEFVKWHLDVGCNLICQTAFQFHGGAWYPTRLGPWIPDPGTRFLGKVMSAAHDAGVPFYSAMVVGQDLFTNIVRPDWLVPDSINYGFPGWLAPESEWTDLLCRRIEEFVSAYPVDGMVFDNFAYGALARGYGVRPAEFVRKPFAEIIGRPMPERAEDITPDENFRYQREILARQFYRIRDAVKSIRPQCVLGFNAPYDQPGDDRWVGHPMLKESDFLFFESTRLDILDWLLSVRRPNQGVFSSISGPPQPGVSDPGSWRVLYERGCDFWGYCWPKPPGFLPGPWYDEDIRTVSEAFHALPG